MSHHHHHHQEMAPKSGGDAGAGDSGAGGKGAESLSNAVQGLFKSIMNGEPPNFKDIAKQLEEGFAKTGDLYKGQS